MPKKINEEALYSVEELIAIEKAGRGRKSPEESRLMAKSWAKALNEQLPDGWEAVVLIMSGGPQIRIRRVKGG